MTNNAMHLVQTYKGKTIQAKYTSVAIDPKKFAKALDSRNLTIAEVARKLGIAESSVSSAKSKGVFGSYLVAGLENVYGIRLSEYEYEPEPDLSSSVEPEVERQEGTLCIDYARLQEIVQNAVTGAVQDVISKNADEIQNIFYWAFIKALKDV